MPTISAATRIALRKSWVCVGAPAAFYTSLIGTRGEEVRAIVGLSDGNLIEVLGVRFTRVGSYAQVQKTWLLDQATLAEAGSTVDDIAESFGTTY